MSALIRIDNATPEQLAVFERNLRRNMKRHPNSILFAVCEPLLNRVHCRQQEWAERNFNRPEIQQEFTQIMQQARINH